MVTLPIAVNKLGEVAVSIKQVTTEPERIPSKEMKGEIVLLRDYYGFVRPFQHDGGRDYWFSRGKGIKRALAMHDEVLFLACVDENGRRRAEKVQLQAIKEY